MHQRKSSLTSSSSTITEASVTPASSIFYETSPSATSIRQDKEEPFLSKLRFSHGPTPSPTTTSLQDEYKLVNWAEAPPYLQDNKFIFTGYRAHFSTPLCLYSVFRMHNETCNIWSHLAPIPFFVALAGYLGWRSFYGGEPELGVTLIYVIAVIISLTTSSIWHTFQCNSKEAYVRLLQVDLSGLCVLMAASYYPPIFYNFRCTPNLRIFYLSAITLFSTLGVCVALFRDMSNARWRRVRILLYGGMAFFSILPTIHTPLLLGWEKTAPIMTLIAVCYACYLIGLVHYALRFPESWKPGHFDIWGHSHTFWHIWIVIGAAVHVATCLVSYSYRNSWGC